jgi:hypothetical protein
MSKDQIRSIASYNYLDHRDITRLFQFGSTRVKSEYAKYVQDILNSGQHVDPYFREFLLKTLVDEELFKNVQNVVLEKGDENVLANYLRTEPRGKGKGKDLFFGPWKLVAQAATLYAILVASTASANIPEELNISSHPVQHGFTTVASVNTSYYPKQAQVNALPSHIDIKNLDTESKKRVIEYRETRNTYLKQGISVPSAPEYDYCARHDKLCGKYPRYIMPQIDNLDTFIMKVNDIGIPMKYSNESIAPHELFSSQSEVSKMGIERKIQNLNDGKGDKAIIISQDNYVIDGHHRFIALLEKGLSRVPIPVKRIDQNHDYIFEAAAAINVDMAPRSTQYSALYPGSNPVTYFPVHPFAKGY